MFLLGVVSPVARSLSLNTRRILSSSKCTSSYMGHENLNLTQVRNKANFRLCNVSGYRTELIEILAENPKLHVIFIPGNPGVVSFYTEFLESLYEELGGTASVTAISHISHTQKNWESGRLFSLQEQIDHKMNFIETELQNDQVPILLVGHSIGSYISLQIFKRCQEKVIYCIGLYPFLVVNVGSSTQSAIKNIARSTILCPAISSIVAFLGMLPTWCSSFLVKKTVGKTWSASAVQALCTHVLQYHTMRNVLYMAMTEFEKLSETPDWNFMSKKKSQIAFLFGLDDHWGPLHLCEEISKQVPDIVLEVEREGHTHAFSCTKAGSLWVARHAANLVKSLK